MSYRRFNNKSNYRRKRVKGYRGRSGPSIPRALMKDSHELKYFDYKDSQTDIKKDATWSSAKNELWPTNHTCCAIPTGGGVTQRNGSRAWLKSMDVRIRVSVPFEVLPLASTNSGQDITVQIIIFLDTANNGSAAHPSAQDILDCKTATDAQSLQCMRNMTKTLQYKVLRKYTVRLSPEVWADSTNSHSPNMDRYITDRINLHWLELNFDSDVTKSGQQDSLMNNAIFGIVNSNYQTSMTATWEPDVYSNIRLRFVDT